MIRSPFILCLCTVAASHCGAATWTEDFSTEPAGNGWKVYGDDSLFNWNAADENLEVAWDSGRANSYFYRPLGAIIARADDFSFEFDLQMTDIAVGVNTNRPFTFELAVGLVQFETATRTNLYRGSGIDSVHGARNLVEFDYFPDSGFGATISPTVVSSNNQFISQFAFPLEIDPGAQFHVAMHYAASNQTLRTTMTRNAEPFGPIRDVVLDDGFSDFRVDHFAICSYSDEGSDGSILAQGIIDNITVTVPDPPISKIAGEFVNQIWQVRFHGASGWMYCLERKTKAGIWTRISETVPSTGGEMFLLDTNPPTADGFYRVRADRP